MKELSLEKQEELKKKMMLNNQRGQLQQLHQQNSRPVNFGSAFGLQTSHGAISSILNQPAYNPYAFHAAPQMSPMISPMQMTPQTYIPSQSANRMMPQQHDDVQVGNGTPTSGVPLARPQGREGQEGAGTPSHLRGPGPRGGPAACGRLAQGALSPRCR